MVPRILQSWVAPRRVVRGLSDMPEGSKLAQLQRTLRAQTRSSKAVARKVVVFFATCAEVDHWSKVSVTWRFGGPWSEQFIDNRTS